MSIKPRAPIRTCHELGVCNGRPSVGCTCNQDAQHDTESLPPGGYYSAPGAIEDGGPSHSKRLTGVPRFVRDCILLLLVSGLIGCAAGYLQVKGWPL